MSLDQLIMYAFLFGIFENGKMKCKKELQRTCLPTRERETEMLHSRAACGLNGSQLAHRNPCPQSPTEEVHFQTPGLQC